MKNFQEVKVKVRNVMKFDVTEIFLSDLITTRTLEFGRGWGGGGGGRDENEESN